MKADGGLPEKRPRGRPKGAKAKVKSQSSSSSVSISVDPILPRKRGRPPKVTTS